MENNARYVECCSAGERAGLYYTCVNSYLTPDEVAYILDNSESKILITSAAKRDVALQAMAQCPRIERCLVVDGPGEGTRVVNLDAAVRAFPDTPIPDEVLGTAMLYSSGTTGRPKGILRPLPENFPAQQLPIAERAPAENENRIPASSRTQPPAGCVALNKQNESAAGDQGFRRLSAGGDWIRTSSTRAR